MALVEALVGGLIIGCCVSYFLILGVDLAGRVEAIGCQIEIVERIIDREAEYVLCLKENQGHLYEYVELLFMDLEKSQYKAYACDYEKTVKEDHGRIEIREYWTISTPKFCFTCEGLPTGRSC